MAQYHGVLRQHDFSAVDRSCFADDAGDLGCGRVEAKALFDTCLDLEKYDKTVKKGQM